MTIRVTWTTRFKRHLMVWHETDMTWSVRWAHPTQHGHKLEAPIAKFRTKKEAMAYKKAQDSIPPG